MTARETRVALIEHGILQEVYIERANKLRIVGNIYKGRVVRVLPGMQAAFIDIGLERTAFLHETDLSANPEPVPINSRLSEGQEILVQVIKDPIGTKGARLTAQLSIASRSLVYIPGLEHISVSLKILDPLERDRLKALLTKNNTEPSKGFIVRTVAEGAECLDKDQKYLEKQWAKLLHKNKFAKCGDLLYQDLGLALRIFRDVVSNKTERVRIDDPSQIEVIEQFINDFVPDFAGKLEVYTEERPLFDLYSINDEISKALERKVQLKSGGYLMIDHTEAMTTIDVNTGAFVGNRNLEETVYRTNLEAVNTICRQLRLRNLGGIIIVDFIDMIEAEHKEKVLRALQKELIHDSIKTTFSDFSQLGLIQITRKRTRESLQHCLCEQCPTCHGRGFVNSVETVVCDIFREIQRFISMYAAGNVMIIASTAVIDYLVEEDSLYLAELEKNLSKIIKLQTEPLYTQEQYDVVLL